MDDGPVTASAPLLASLAASHAPFVQHAAYLDLVHVAESGGGGRRGLLFGDAKGAAYSPAMAAALAPVLAVTAAMRVGPARHCLPRHPTHFHPPFLRVQFPPLTSRAIFAWP